MITAAQVLKETQEACEKLESNLAEVARKHKSLQTIGYLDPSLVEKDAELMRIRKSVDKKIKEIESEIHFELLEKSKHLTKAEKRTRIPLSQRQLFSQKQPLPENKVFLSQKFKQTVPNIPSNISASFKNSGKLYVEKKIKPKLNSKRVFDQFVAQHLLGNQPQRKHLRSPTKITNQPGVLKAANNLIIESSVKNTFKKSKSKENFQPELNLSLNPVFHNCFIKNDLLGIAIPLANPNQDPNGRLPLVYEPDGVKESFLESDMKVLHHVKGPNVAVINVKSDSLLENESSSNLKSRLKAKVQQRIRNKLKMNLQTLPNIDIDTSDFSSSTGEQSKIIENSQTLVKDSKCEEDELSYHFQAHNPTQDMPIEKTIDNESESSFNDGFCISGCQQPFKPENESGPTFPPTHVKSQPLYNVPTLSADELQLHAQEWLEHELLSRLVSQMNIKATDPTLKEVVNTIKVQSVLNEEENSDPSDWIENVIGLKGLQMFVDAGIPIDRNLVDELIRSVLLEMLETMYGYPPPPPLKCDDPQKIDNILSATPTPILTPIQTPTRTRSPLSSPLPHLLTPERSISELTEQLIDDVEIITESVSAVSLHQNSIKTPDSSIISLTPDDKIHVETPEVSIYVSEKNQINVNTPRQTLTPVESLMQQEDLPFSEHSLQSENKDIASNLHGILDPKIEQELSVSPISVNGTSSNTIETPTTSTGISTFEGISLGELLNPSFAEMCEGVSEGELGFPFGVSMLKYFQELPEDLEYNSFDTKTILKKIIASHNSKETVKSKPNSSKGLNTSCSVGEIIRPVKSLGEIISLKDEAETNYESFEFGEISTDAQKSEGEINIEMLTKSKRRSSDYANNAVVCGEESSTNDEKRFDQLQLLNLRSNDNGKLKPVRKNSFQDEQPFRSEGEVFSGIHDTYTEKIQSIDDNTLVEDDLSQYDLSS